MENLIFQLVLERPDDPAVFMIDWLQKTAGYTYQRNKKSFQGCQNCLRQW